MSSPINSVLIVEFYFYALCFQVIVDAQKRVFSWGFGGYGRLGHAEPKDEMIPRLIKVFDAQSRGVRSVFAGNSYSMALTELGEIKFG